MCWMGSRGLIVMLKTVFATSLVLLLVACGEAELTSPAAGDMSDSDPKQTQVSADEPQNRSPAGYVNEGAIRTAEASSSAANGYWGVKEGEALPIIWQDLMPEGAEEALDQEYAAFYADLQKRYAALDSENGLEIIEEGSDLDYMPQLGSFETVKDLDGMLVRIPGYVVPFDFEGDNTQSAFLFAPYMGACIHTPPPPPNQIIYVTADPGVKIDDIWTAYWLEGTLKAETQESSLASAAYTLTLTKLELYGAP